MMVRVRLERLHKLQHALAAWRTFYRTLDDRLGGLRHAQQYRDIRGMLKWEPSHIEKAYTFNRTIMYQHEFDALQKYLEDCKKEKY